tara:strand:+ start:24049 stop:24873 length:825 start_codon:yes stop_codon:yes gene_type:complete
MTNNNLDMSLQDSQINSLNALIDKIAARQLKDFGNINTDLKPDGTLITDCDRWSDLEIVSGIQKIAPNEGILSEEGSKLVPDSNAFWVVDPLDGTTNFAAGIPYWAISIARFVNGKPQTALLDIPALKKRIVAINGKGAWLNQKPIKNIQRDLMTSECISLCSRSIRILQLNPNQPFPGKIRLLGVSSLNMTSVALGQTIGALEATPKIWDLGAAWLILKELNCCIEWLDKNPIDILAGEDLGTVNFPLLTTSSEKTMKKLIPWANMLIKPPIK